MGRAGVRGRLGEETGFHTLRWTGYKEGQAPLLRPAVSCFRARTCCLLSPHSREETDPNNTLQGEFILESFTVLFPMFHMKGPPETSESFIKFLLWWSRMSVTQCDKEFFSNHKHGVKFLTPWYLTMGNRKVTQGTWHLLPQHKWIWGFKFELLESRYGGFQGQCERICSGSKSLREAAQLICGKQP